MRRRSVNRNRMIGLGLTLGLLASFALGTSAVSAREANGAASCMGIELSAITPPGSSDEVPGGALAFGRDVKAIASGLSVPAGVVYRFIAGLHAGSHEACDAAFE
jgi:hypothetical protein